jgi:hypothetical protein
MQLVISRRNPKLLGPDPDDKDSHWGFTIVRRERPEGGRKNSILSYLAPVGVGTEHPDRKGDVLSFSAPTMKIYPDKESPYGREATYGTAIKLYDYKYLGERSNIIRGRSILSRLDLLLPEIALPIRLYEFRKNQHGKYLEPGSRETSLSGLGRRLNNTSNVEDGFPIRLPFSPAGEQLFATVYAFKPAGTARDDEEDEDDSDSKKKKLGGAKRYRKREGVLFVRNGQTQGTLPKDFFRRDQLKLKTLADDLLVFVECDQMSDENREDLFMPSRDRLTENDFKVEMIDVLEQTLRMDETLRQLRNKRQKELMSEQLKDDKPLADVLQNLVKNSPNLTTLLQLGQRINAPFSAKPTGSHEKPFKGEVYPSFFKVKGTNYGENHKRECPINYRMRLTFETDARDDYFKRRIESGKFSMVWVDKTGEEHKVSIVGPNLRSGSATVMVTLPEGVAVGDVLRMTALTEDSRATFKNAVEVTVRPWAEHHKGGGTKKKDKTPDNQNGNDREKPHQLSTPKMDPVYRDRWHKFNFDEYTAMKMDVEYDDDNNETPVFRINMDNTPLLNEIKHRRLDDQSARNQFMYGNVLIGLALLLQDKDNGEQSPDVPQVKVEDRIDTMCRALAPFMLSLTTLAQQDLSDSEQFEGLEAATG